MSFKTEQENFWAGDFGDSYIERNQSKEYLASNLSFFAKSMSQVGKINSLIEFGPNVGMNLAAIKNLYPSIELHGVEVNSKAAKELGALIGQQNVSNTSILDFTTQERYDVTLIKGVLIHINPNQLSTVYQKLYELSNKYILICEYYNPVPVSINYRGHEDRLFKRDFAGEIMDLYKDLSLIDYGFVYHKDPVFPQDDVTWFLLQKKTQN
jgi:spore coat polysaccharide biosynthesis protein SpsF